MKKTINKKKDLTFYKLSFGSMICGYIAIGLILISFIITSINIQEQQGFDPSKLSTLLNDFGMYFEVLAILALLAMTILNIAQAVAHSHYGDIDNKLTRENTQKLFIIFLSILGGCLVLALLWGQIKWPEVINPEDPSKVVTVWWAEILNSIVTTILEIGMIGSAVAHLGINTAIVVKLHQPK